jgi:hypothetical protein
LLYHFSFFFRQSIEGIDTGVYFSVCGSDGGGEFGAGNFVLGEILFPLVLLNE